MCSAGDCAICLEPFEDARATCELPCGHVFHTVCMLQSGLSGNYRCPICRHPFRWFFRGITRSVTAIFSLGIIFMLIVYPSVFNFTAVPKGAHATCSGSIVFRWSFPFTFLQYLTQNP